MKSYTPISLWKDFDPESYPFDATLFRQETVDGFVVQTYLFCGDKIKKQSSRVLAKVVFKSTKKKLPVVVVVDPFERINVQRLCNWAKQGYMAMAIDYLGESDQHDGMMTIYPKSMQFANYNEAKDKLRSVNGDARKCCWYQWTLNTRRAIAFAKTLDNADPENIGIYSIRGGNIIVIQTMAMDKNVKTGAVMYGNLWETFEHIAVAGANLDARTIKQNIEILGNNDEWLAAISPQSYLSYIKQPFFTCVGTNSPKTDMDRTYECLSRMGNDGNGMVLFIPRAMDSMLSEYMKNLEKWFAQQLLPTESKFNMRDVDIDISARINDGNVEIVAQSDSHFSSLDLYYCRDKQRTNGTRNWVCQTMKKQASGGYFTTLKLFDPQTPVIAFCNATFRNGVRVSSNLLKFVPDKKFAGEEISLSQRSPVIYVGDLGTAEFTPMTPMGTQRGPFVDENPVSQACGPFDIAGLYGTRMGSFIIGDDCMQVGNNSLLMMDVCSNEPQDLNVYFVVDWGKDSLTVYKHTCKLKGGANWQKISLSAGDFKDDLRARTVKELSFAEASVICFEAKEGVMLNNVIFT